ncbi:MULTISPECIES: SDR family oxidoreductase [unclassified Mesorhizobium]|uniref:SDR family oxidoreductase n=1 Tax=unclassified Mesorhizobium TaxID=325217 RepID=UPI0024171862|nr:MULTISPECIES: SDR family oxidoreductase [unclassified Mesorhizobium]WFP66049.1 SDR family oxidoreductase [Mesorhizobium sp. WSM4904]WFP79330.1 SDR family oxidoreductase [Mesorhizobium sp. WSM4906]
MRVLVTGSGGLIGTAICARLISEGCEVVRVSRREPDRADGDGRVVIDMAKALAPEDWNHALQGIDAVVNCAGVLQDSALDHMAEVHASGAAALFRACARAGVRRIIHFSAIGVDREQPSAFSASKLVGDEALMALDLDWIILRPSVVLGQPVFGASALIRGLAALPVLPLMPDTGRLQVVQLGDVVETVIFFLSADSPSRVAVELAGPDAFTMEELIAHYRKWFGWTTARVFALPHWAARLLYRLGDAASILEWRPPVRTNAAREITRGAIGDPEPWKTATGIEPQGLAAALAANPATVQDRWFAGLYFIKPVIFTVLPFFWIMTGVISLTTGWASGVQLLVGTSVGALAAPLVVAGALADMIVGALIAFRKTARTGLLGAIGICIFYALAGTILRPDLWNEPLGPLIKILPIVLLHLVALAVLEER